MRRSQRRALRRIERDLARSDPRLALLFLSLTGLGRGKEMPDAEMIRARPRWLATRLGQRADPHRVRAGRPARPPTIR